MIMKYINLRIINWLFKAEKFPFAKNVTDIVIGPHV